MHCPHAKDLFPAGAQTQIGFGIHCLCLQLLVCSPSTLNPKPYKRQTQIGFRIHSLSFQLLVCSPSTLNPKPYKRQEASVCTLSTHLPSNKKKLGLSPTTFLGSSKRAPGFADTKFALAKHAQRHLHKVSEHGLEFCFFWALTLHDPSV